MNEKYDIVVVGSGAGGAPLAHALTKAGAKVCVIERGKALEELSLDRDEIEWTRRKRFMPHARNDPHMFRKDESTRALATARAWTGNIVGGSTVTSDALMLRASEADFVQGDRMNKIAGIKAPNWPFGLAELAPYYDEAERFLGVKKAKEQGLKTHAIAGFLDAAAAKVGHRLSRAERAIVTRDRGLQKACEYRTLCEQYACPSNANRRTRRRKRRAKRHRSVSRRGRGGRGRKCAAAFAFRKLVQQKRTRGQRFVVLCAIRSASVFAPKRFRKMRRLYEGLTFCRTIAFAHAKQGRTL